MSSTNRDRRAPSRPRTRCRCPAWTPRSPATPNCRPKAVCCGACSLDLSPNTCCCGGDSSSRWSSRSTSRSWSRSPNCLTSRSPSCSTSRLLSCSPNCYDELIHLRSIARTDMKARTGCSSSRAWTSCRTC